MPCPNNTTDFCKLQGVVQTGAGSKNTITHDKNVKQTLTINGGDTPLFSLQRAFTYSDESSSNSTGGQLCGLNTSPLAVWKDYTGSSTFKARISENYTVFTSEILFMDLRHDIVVTRETKTEIVFDVESDKQAKGYTNDLGNYPLHWFKDFTFEALVTTTDKLNGKIIDTVSTTIHAGLDIAMIQPAGWETLEPLVDFQQYNRDNEGPTGYYPQWLRGFSTKDHLYAFDVHIMNDVYKSAGDTPYSIADLEKLKEVVGSFAVDLLGNRFFCHKTKSGTIETSLTNVDGSTVNLAELVPDTYPALYPIAPV